MKTRTRTSKFFMSTMLLILIVGASSACNQLRQSATDSGSYLHTDIDGMENGDENLEGIKYEIICNDRPDKRITGKIEDEDRNRVSFPEEELNLGAKCALEITADAREKAGVGTYEWKARRKDNTPYVGLFYSSNFAKVELNEAAGKVEKYLAFTVIKTYGIAYNDPFTARVPVDFEKEDGAIIPQSAGLLASLECHKTGAAESQPFYESSIGVQPGSHADQRLFDFKLSSHKMQGTSCTKLTVAIDNVVLYEGAMSHVRFTSPEVNATPKTDKNLLFDPVTVAPNQESFGIIECDGRNEANQCTAIKINRGAELWFAVVVIEVGGEDKDYVVTPGFGLGIDPNLGSKSIEDLQMHIDQKAPPESFTYFRYAQARPKLIGTSDDTKAILQAPYTDATAAAIASARENLSSLQGGKVKHFKAAYTHGFRTVSEGFLNSLSGARWFAKTKVSDGGRLVADVLIAGGKKYFETINHLRPAGGQGAFLTKAEYQRDNSPSDNRYRTYTFQGGSWAESCGLTFDHFRQSIGQKTQEQLGQTDAQIDACEVTDASKLNQLKPNNLVFSPRYYLWGWHAARFQ